MIVKFNKPVDYNGMRLKGEVMEVNDTHGKELINNGLADKIPTGYKNRKTKPDKTEYKQNGAWVNKYVNGEKVKSLRKSEAKKHGWID